MYIGKALIIDVITTLTILPIMVYLFKPKYVFDLHEGSAPQATREQEI